jgi:trigger factor
MTVTKKITPLEKSNIKLTVIIPKEDIHNEYALIIKEYSKKIQIPGFRRGKVPKEVLERKFGENLKNEALGKIIEKAIGEVFENDDFTKYEKPLPYCQPELTDKPILDFEHDLEFSLTYDVLPKIEVGTWKGYSIEGPVCEISNDDINRELYEIQQRNAIVLDKDDDIPAANNDVVTIDFWELDDIGGLLPNGERLDFTYTLGTGANTYDFDDEITGMKINETKEFIKTYSMTHQEFPNMSKKIKLTLKSLKEKKLPDLNDDLAQDVDDKYKTLDDLKNSIQKRLNTRLTARLRVLNIGTLLKKIMDITPVVLPESMIQMEIEANWRNMARRIGLPAEKVMELMAASGKNPDDIQNEWRPGAEKALHSRLIIETLIEQEKIDVTDEELASELAILAEESNTSIEDMEKYYQDDKMKGYFIEEVKEKKLYNILLAENTIKPGKRENFLEIMKENR